MLLGFHKNCSGLRLRESSSQRRPARFRGLPSVALVSGKLLLGALAITLAARLSFPLPGTPVPQTAQTLGVLLVGVFLGPTLGVLSVVLYLLAGLIGLPVFADGASGAAKLIGPTAGFLFGFVLAAWLAGRWARLERARSLAFALLGMVIAHCLLLFVGWLWLSRSLGFERAFSLGVAPFWVGALIKSVAAAVVLVGVARREAA